MQTLSIESTFAPKPPKTKIKKFKQKEKQKFFQVDFFLHNNSFWFLFFHKKGRTITKIDFVFSVVSQLSTRDSFLAPFPLFLFLFSLYMCLCVITSKEKMLKIMRSYLLHYCTVGNVRQFICWNFFTPQLLKLVCWKKW